MMDFFIALLTTVLTSAWLIPSKAAASISSFFSFSITLLFVFFVYNLISCMISSLLGFSNVIILENLLQTAGSRSEEHTSELQSRPHLVCRLLLEKKKNKINKDTLLNTINTYIKDL